MVVTVLLLLLSQEPVTDAAGAASTDAAALHVVEPAPPTADPSEPATPGPAPDAAQAPASTAVLDDCRALVDRGALAEAKDCYRRVAVAHPANAALALTLAEIVSDVELRAPTLTVPARDPFSLESFTWSGRAELLGAAVVTGGAAAAVGASTMVAILEDAVASSAFSTLVPVALLLTPVFGGVLGGAVAAWGIHQLPDAVDGDIHLVRAGLWMGAFEGFVVGVLFTTLTDNPLVIGSGMIMTWAGASVLSLSAAALIDVVDSAPSLGLSFAWIGATLGALGLAAVDLEGQGLASTSIEQGTALAVGGGGILGYVAGVGAAQVLRLSRPVVWIIDVGAAAGLLGGAAFAVGVRAGSPLVGWGTIMAGTMLGTGGGVAAAAWLSSSGSAESASTAPRVSLSPAVWHDGRGAAPGMALRAALP